MLIRDVGNNFLLQRLLCSSSIIWVLDLLNVFELVEHQECNVIPWIWRPELRLRFVIIKPNKLSVTAWTLKATVVRLSLGLAFLRFDSFLVAAQF